MPFIERGNLPQIVEHILLFEHPASILSCGHYTLEKIIKDRERLYIREEVKERI